MKAVIQALIEGGKASAGPPLGPALGPMGVNVQSVIAAINEKTKEFAGLSIPVKVIIDRETKSFDVEVGSPPTSALIKKELGIEKGAKAKGEKAGDISLEQAVKIAKAKSASSLSKDLARAVKEVLGTCLSMGVTCEGKDPRAVLREIEEGKHRF